MCKCGKGKVRVRKPPYGLRAPTRRVQRKEKKKEKRSSGKGKGKAKAKGKVKVREAYE